MRDLEVINYVFQLVDVLLLLKIPIRRTDDMCSSILQRIEQGLVVANKSRDIGIDRDVKNQRTRRDNGDLGDVSVVQLDEGFGLSPSLLF